MNDAIDVVGLRRMNEATEKTNAIIAELTRQNGIMRSALRTIAGPWMRCNSVDDPPSFLRANAAIALEAMDPLSIAAGIIAAGFVRPKQS